MMDATTEQMGLTMTTTTLRDRFHALAAYLRATTLERDVEIGAMIRCAIAGRHMLLLGPPGTAKSRLVDAFADAVDATLFPYLLTRYTEPAELFGPIDVKLMADEGRLKRRTAGYLPEADVVFLDEAFKANSAILNTMLGVLNERQLFDDGARRRLPLRFAMLASNEVPEVDDHSVGAFYDRILVRLHVGYLADDRNFATLVRRQMQDLNGETILTLADLDAARVQASEVAVTDEAIASITTIRAELSKAGVAVSDRRWIEVVDYLRAHAWLAGVDAVDVVHVGAAACCLWSRPDQIPIVEAVLTEHAPSWEAEARAIRASVAEQMQAIAVARGISEPKKRMEALGDVSSVLAELSKDVDSLRATTAAAVTTADAIAGEIKAAEDSVVDVVRAGHNSRKAQR